jgi:hypothetical protein
VGAGAQGIVIWIGDAGGGTAINLGMPYGIFSSHDFQEYIEVTATTAFYFTQFRNSDLTINRFGGFTENGANDYANINIPLNDDNIVNIIRFNNAYNYHIVMCCAATYNKSKF